MTQSTARPIAGARRAERGRRRWPATATPRRRDRRRAAWRRPCRSSGCGRRTAPLPPCRRSSCRIRPGCSSDAGSSSRPWRSARLASTPPAREPSNGRVIQAVSSESRPNSVMNHGAPAATTARSGCSRSTMRRAARSASAWSTAAGRRGSSETTVGTAVRQAASSRIATPLASSRRPLELGGHAGRDRLHGDGDLDLVPARRCAGATLRYRGAGRPRPAPAAARPRCGPARRAASAASTDPASRPRPGARPRRWHAALDVEDVGEVGGDLQLEVHADGQRVRVAQGQLLDQAARQPPAADHQDLRDVARTARPRVARWSSPVDRRDARARRPRRTTAWACWRPAARPDRR